MKNSEDNSHDLAELEELVGHTFNDRSWLERALTHRSWAHEQVAPGKEEEARRLHNEALEFVGDSVLGLVVADFLFSSYPDVTEGELSRMKHQLVSAPTLARASERLTIGRFVRVGRGEDKSGGRLKRALLADAFEAVLAAVFLDGGLPAAADFVRRALGDELEQVDPEAAAAADFKTLLQERLQASHLIRAAVYGRGDDGAAAQAHFPRRAELGRRLRPRRGAHHQGRRDGRRTTRARQSGRRRAGGRRRNAVGEKRAVVFNCFRPSAFMLDLPRQASLGCFHE